MSGHRTHSIVLGLWLSAFPTFMALSSTAALGETKNVTVHTGDLDLTTDAGRAALRRRIARAVEHVCGSPYDLTLAQLPAYQKCSKPALADAMSQYTTAVAAAQNARQIAGGKASVQSVQ